MELLKLEVGKTYMNSVGHPVKIVEEIVKGLQYLADNDLTYSIEGVVFYAGRPMKDHKQCLVIEEVKPLPYAIMIDYMVDLETMGLDNNSLITTISIVRFDLGTGDIGDEFEIAIDWKEQTNNKAILDVDTVQWWLKQDPDAIKNMMRLPTCPVDKSLDKLDAFLNSGIDLKKVRLWGNGKEFDNVILRNLYKRHGRLFPIPYWCDNDVRTLVSLSGINTKNFEFKGIKHRGIDDCKHQINYCSHAYNTLKSK